MTKLLIVESPGKLKTLRQILGRDWILEASVGHTTELASDGYHRWGFDLLNDRVETRYVPRGDRGKRVLAQLRKAVKNADEVYLATDPDREGEAIAWHLVEQLRLKKYHRVSYTQITEAAVRRAVQNPGRLHLPLIQSQRARQCLDKLVGFEVSPLLWNSTGGKSAGRVQSATLHLVCERERERLAFKPEKYWVLKSLYGEGFEAFYEPPATKPGQELLIRPEAQPGSGMPSPAKGSTGASDGADDKEEIITPRVRTAEEARRVEQIARMNPHIVKNTDSKEETRYPPPPFITSSLQQMAGARFRFSPKKTMDTAQELYEGVQGKGLITYMRTDSISLSPEFAAEAADWIGANSPESLPAKPPVYRAKGDAQAAHEAIRPTSVDLTPEKAAKLLSPDQLKLYTMIWERAIASQCRPARLSRSRIQIECADTRWIARGMSVIDPGYLKFWKNTEDEKTLPPLQERQTLSLKDVKVDERTTEPPPRYTEPKLVQLMEKRGIGRPSTYASTITTLKDRDYVVLEKNFVVPTPLGMSTDETLGRALPDLVNPEFTAKMESALDAIAEGKLSWERYLIEWNTEYLEPALVSARQLIGGSAPSMAHRSEEHLAHTPSMERRPLRADAPSTAHRVLTVPDRSTVDSAPSENAPFEPHLSRPTRLNPAPRPSAPENPGPKRTARTTKSGGRNSTPSRTSATSRAFTSSGSGTPANGRIQKAEGQARKKGVVPSCAQGHGELTLRQSAKGAFYWRCTHSGCENFSWYQEFSSERCPDCGAPLEKIPSKKVTGGYFLKCKRAENHPQEVVLFRNRQTKAWERAGGSKGPRV